MDEQLVSAMMDLINQHGGVGGMLQQFEQGGLGAVAQSWLSPTAANQAVSSSDLGQTLDQDKVAAVAQQNGMSSEDLLSQLATHLPQIMDQMTPQGQVPDQASHGGLMDLAMGFLRSR